MGAIFPFFQSPGSSPDCHDFSHIMESGLPTTSANSLRMLGCIFSGPVDLCQVPQVVTNLIFSYSGRDFASPVPVMQSIHSRGVGREAASEDWGKKVIEYLSLALVHCYQSASLAHQVGYAFFDLPFLADIPVEALLTMPCIPCQVQLLLCLGLLIPSLHNWAVSLYSSQPAKVPLNGSTTAWCISCSSQFCSISRLAEGAYCWWLASSCILCCWSPPFEVSHPAKFQSSSLSA